MTVRIHPEPGFRSPSERSYLLAVRGPQAYLVVASKTERRQLIAETFVLLLAIVVVVMVLGLESVK